MKSCAVHGTPKCQRNLRYIDPPGGIVKAIQVLGAAALALASLSTAPAEATRLTPASAAAPTVDDVRRALATLDQPWVANAGQWDERVAFRARHFAGATWVTTGGELVHALAVAPEGPASRLRNDGLAGPPDAVHTGWTLVERFVGAARTPPIRGAAPTAERVNFFVGDTTRHATAVGTFKRLELGEVFPGIAVSLAASANNIEKLFTVAPGAHPDRIMIEVDGSDRLAIAEDGRLIAHTALGDIVFTAPVAFQDIRGIRHPVQVAYTLDRTGRRYGFRLGTYDRTQPVVIDPLLQSTFVGGGGGDNVTAIAISPLNGDVYVAGVTVSGTSFPGITGGAQSTAGGSLDGFVTRFSASLTQRKQSTLFGGTGDDTVTAVGAHPFYSSVYIAGRTTGTLPGTTGGAQASPPGGSADGFIARFSDDLTVLQQATYVGGSSFDGVYGIAFHSFLGHVYAVGQTRSKDLPNTAGSFQPTAGKPLDTNDYDAFIVRLNSDLTTLFRTSYLGGSNSDQGNAIGTHPTNYDVYVAGATTSGLTAAVPFPGTSGGAQATDSPPGDGFICRVNQSLSTLQQCTYFGGGGQDTIYALAIHPTLGRVFTAGETTSASLPGTTGAAQTALAGSTDAFVARHSLDLTTLDRATFLGGENDDRALSIAIGPGTTDVFVSGTTTSSDLPGLPGAARPFYTGASKAFVGRLTTGLGNFFQVTYLGGSADEQGLALAVHPTGEVFAGGVTNSSNFPKVAGGAQSTIGAFNDGFVARISRGLDAATQSCLLDLDGDGTFRMTTDGLLMLRMMLGLTGAAVTEGAVSPLGIRKTHATIVADLTAYCGSVGTCLPNVDGSTGAPDAATDGLLLIRALAGLTGTAVTCGALGSMPTRSTWSAIRSYLNANCGTSFP